MRHNYRNTNVRKALAMTLCLVGVLHLVPLPTESTRAIGTGGSAPVPKDPRAADVREFEVADGLKVKFCWIPGGEAQLGSPKAEQEAVIKQLDRNVFPLDFHEHHTSLLAPEAEEVRGKFKTKGFWLGKYPVTQAEWKAVMGDNPSIFNGKVDNAAKGLETGRFPVDSVSWNDCQKFLEKLNTRDGVATVFGKAGQFVLPHEDQWEYACRGGNGNARAFYFGNELNGTQANCDGEEPYGTDKKGDWKKRPTHVGSYEKDWPHPWGLCDMHGNVWQWCENKPEPGNDARAYRGGSWFNNALDCRSAHRGKLLPHWHEPNYGFRVCLKLE